MKITFIKPNIGRLEHSLYVDEGRMEPLQLGVLAGLTPPDVECVLYDDRIETIPYDEPTDLAAITVEIYTARRAYEIAAEYRQARRAGDPGRLSSDAGSRGSDGARRLDPARRCRGTLAQVVADAKSGQLRRVYRGSLGEPQPGGVKPRRDLFKGKGYLPVTLMQFRRGCRFRCDFCAISAFFNHSHYVRQTNDVLDEIAAQERKFVFFVDDNFLSNHEAAKLFLRELIPMRIRWVSQASIDMTDDPELMDLLEESGCLGNVIGFESLDPRNIKGMRKAPEPARRTPDWDNYRRAARSCAIITCRPGPHSRSATITTPSSRSRRRTTSPWRTSSASPPTTSSCPIPNTPLYTRLQREGRLLWDGKWWLHPEYRFNHAAFVPKNMTPDELTEACWYCRSQWNTPLAIFQRMWDWKTHLSSLYRLGVYLKYNPIYGRETFRKQGMLFGLSRNSINTQTPGPLRDRTKRRSLGWWRGKKCNARAAPHPSPLPGGERGLVFASARMSRQRRAQLSPLSPRGERVRVRGGSRAKSLPLQLPIAPLQRILRERHPIRTIVADTTARKTRRRVRGSGGRCGRRSRHAARRFPRARPSCRAASSEYVPA